MSAVLDLATRAVAPRSSRRSRVAEAASAMAVAPIRFATRPVSADAVMRKTCCELSGRQPLLRLLHGVVLHPPGRR